MNFHMIHLKSYRAIVLISFIENDSRSFFGILYRCSIFVILIVVNDVLKWKSNLYTYHAIIKLASLLIIIKLFKIKEIIVLLGFKYAIILIVAQICTAKVEVEQKIKEMKGEKWK